MTDHMLVTMLEPIYRRSDFGIPSKTKKIERLGYLLMNAEYQNLGGSSSSSTL